MNKMQNDYNDAINFAIDESDDCELFLNMWREGEWERIEKEWPEFKISDELKNHVVQSSKLITEGRTELTIDDIQISFKDNIIRIELINGDDHVEYSVDFFSIAELYKLEVNHTSDELPSQVCAAIEYSFRECKSMLLRGYK